MRLGL
jgi:hypothetical protein